MENNKMVKRKDNKELANVRPHPNCKLTPEVQEIICDWIGKGNYIVRLVRLRG